MTERLSILLEATGAGGVIADFNKVAGATRGLGDRATRTTGLLGRLGPAGQQAGGMLAGGMAAGAAAAGVAIAGLAVKSVKAFTDLGQQVIEFQRASGATTEQSSALVAAFDDMAISAQTGSQAIFQLGKRLATNADGLAAYGVRAVKGADGNVDLAQTFLSVADAYNATADPARQAALLTAAFGKQGRDLIPILEKGSAGIRDLFADAERTGQILSPEEAQKAEDFRVAMDGLNDALGKLAIEAGKALIPLAQDLAELTTSGLEFVDKVLNAKVGGDSWFSQLLDALNPMRSLIGASDVSAESLDEMTHAADYNGRIVFNMKGKHDEAAESVANLGKEVDTSGGLIDEINQKLEASTFAAVDAQRAYDSAARAVVDADRNLAEARETYNKLLEEGAVNEEKVADARRSLNDATRSLGSAQRRLAEAQEEHNDAQAAFLALPSDTNADKLRDASDGLADAKDSVASASEREQEAQADLAKARAGDPSFNDKLTAAKLRVKDAELGVAEAQYTQSQRAFELNVKLGEQNTLLGDNATAVAGVRTEWEKLIALKPEFEAFLKGPLTALGQVGSNAGVPGIDLRARREEREFGMSGSAPGGLLTGGGGGNLSPVTNNNIQITVEGTTDPMALAQAILWNLR